MSPETPQRCPHTEVLVTGGWCRCGTLVKVVKHTAPVPAPKHPSGNNLAMSGESEANITEREASPESLRMLKQEIAEALEPDLNCGYCHGSGAMDSGGVTPWGTGIDIRCNCTYPEPAAAPTGMPRPIRQAGKHLRSITTPVMPTGQDDPESDESAEFSYQLLSSSIVPEQIPEPDKPAPTGTGDRTGTKAFQEAAMKTFTREDGTGKGSEPKMTEYYGHCPKCGELLGFGHLPEKCEAKPIERARSAFELAADASNLKKENAALRSQLEEALRELADEHSADAQIQEQYAALERDLATAQARIARVEEAVQEFGHHHSCCDIMRQSHIYQECTCGYWKFCKVCQSKPEARAALTEPQSGEK